MRGGCMSLKIWARGAVALLMFLAICVLGTAGAFAQSAVSNVKAFSDFVEAEKYDDANFYLSNGFITADQIDTGQLFYDVFSQQYSRKMTEKRGSLDQLYSYLNALKPFDLNRMFKCDEGRCLLVNDLMHGKSTTNIAWFLERGLELNKRVPEVVPATLPLVLRLGFEYTMQDMNWLTQNGMVLGDEIYTLEELVAYRDAVSRHNADIAIPDDFANISNFNFLDVLVISLTTRTRIDEIEESRRRDFMCQFITYAASSYAPSFDYLAHIMLHVAEFRGQNIGKADPYGKKIYRPFPDSCVQLITAMAASHAQLDTVINIFASRSDVNTASWLLSIRKQSNEGN